MTQIIITKPGTLNQRDKSALRKSGVVCVEADDPADVRLISAEGSQIGGSELLLAAMRGILADPTDRSHRAFAIALTASLESELAERHKEPTQ